MKKLKALIVDDERLARDEIRRHLGNQPEIEIVGEATNITDAANMMGQLHPDIIFLDVQMPGGSGFDLLESLDTVPQVIFTTAFNQYAVQAFEVDATDYLVKPIREERFTKTIEKIRARLASEGKEHPHEQTIFIREGERCHFIKVSRISWIESSGNYAKLYFDDKKALIKRSLNHLEKTLAAGQFFRVNRTATINMNYITKIKPLPDGRLDINLQGGQSFTVSGRQSAALKNRSIL
jgi:two-component system LytT family response regulator